MDRNISLHEEDGAPSGTRTLIGSAVMLNSGILLKKTRKKSEAPGNLVERAYHLIWIRFFAVSCHLVQLFRAAAWPSRNRHEHYSHHGSAAAAGKRRTTGKPAPRGHESKIPTVEETKSRVEMREALECQSARLCAERSTLQERLDLKRSAEQMDVLSARAAANALDKELKFAEQTYHTELHMKIAVYARSEALRAALENMHVLVFNWLYNTVTGGMMLPEGFHQQLIETIVSGNPDVAEAAMRAHVRFGTANVLRAVSPESNGRWRARR